MQGYYLNLSLSHDRAMQGKANVQDSWSEHLTILPKNHAVDQTYSGPQMPPMNRSMPTNATRDSIATLPTIRLRPKAAEGLMTTVSLTSHFPSHPRNQHKICQETSRQTIAEETSQKTEADAPAWENVPYGAHFQVP